MKTHEPGIRRRPGRPAGRSLPHVIRMYEDATGVERVKRLAEERGMPVAAFLRQLVKEEDERVRARRRFRESLTPEAVEQYIQALREGDEEWLAAVLGDDAGGEEGPPA